MFGPTKRDGPADRPWEYHMLDAVAKDSWRLVQLVAGEHQQEIKWEERVSDTYGRADDETQVYYLLRSFGLKWQVGDTLLDTAKLNGKTQAAHAIERLQQQQEQQQQQQQLQNPLPCQIIETGRRICNIETVRVALVQSPSDIGAVARNLAGLKKHIQSAAQQGAKVIVLPETSVTGYLSQDLQTNWGVDGRPQSFPKSIDPCEFAETRIGNSVLRMAALARELRVYVTVPYLEKEHDRTPNGLQITRFYNSVALVGPESTKDNPALAHYRKNCPWPHPEKSWASPGAGVQESTYDTPYGKVGLAVCFDIHSILAKYDGHNLWALLYPIAWVGDTDRWFASELPDRLQHVNCPHYILGANWATTAPQTWEGAGGSTAYGPGGTVLAHAMEPRFRGCATTVIVDIPTQHSWHVWGL